MAVATDKILHVLRERGVFPSEEIGDVDLPGIGEVEEGLPYRAEFFEARH
jgi:hypothetical protein